MVQDCTSVLGHHKELCQACEDANVGLGLDLTKQVVKPRQIVHTQKLALLL